MRRILHEAVLTAGKDTMNRRVVLGGAALGIAFMVFPIIANAVTSPPVPPTTYFGAAPGAVPGQTIIALIDPGTGPIVCGSGNILATPSSGTVYTIDVMPDATRSGCGAYGRVIQFYVAPAPPAAARVAVNLVPWNAGPAVQQDLVLGPRLNQRRGMPESASDGTY